jgi:hypothetical protein
MALLNYGIIRNNTDRLPALICALFNGALFFSGFPLLNYLPRFLLAGLLIFAGLPFISTNLVDSYKHMTKKEFFATWAIVILTALFGLLVGVVAGVGMAALIFAIQSGRRKCVSSVIFGSDYQSTVVRSVMQARCPPGHPPVAFTACCICWGLVLLSVAHAILLFTGAQAQTKTHSHTLHCCLMHHRR